MSAVPPAPHGRPDGAGAPPERGPDRAVTAWLVVILAMVFVMVVLGGVTRLTQSGLSMVDWRPITGILPPLSAAAWEEAFAAYKRFPEYRALNYGMTLAEFKAIFWMEYVHRLWGRLIGAAFLLPYLWFLARGAVRGRLARHLAGVFALGAAQGAMGWIMVQSGLVDRPSVSPYRLTAHLALALAIYGWLLVLLMDRVLGPPAAPAAAAPLRRPARATLALVVVTALSGGFVAGLDAGMTYNTFPLMDGQWVPDGILALEPAWRNPFENVATVQFDHRVLAVATVAGALWLWARARVAALPPRARLAADLTAAMALVQPALGITALLLVVPVALGAAHQAGALVLFGLALWTVRELRGPPRRPA